MTPTIIPLITSITGWTYNKWVSSVEHSERGEFIVPGQVISLRWPSLDTLHEAEKAAGLHNRENSQLRTKWVNKLRDIVAVECPKNKMGAPLVSDVDLLNASFEQRTEAFEKTFA